MVIRHLDVVVHRPALPLVYELNTRTHRTRLTVAHPQAVTGISTDTDPNRTTGLQAS